MSEHMSIKGKVNYYHIPYREDNGFSYCKRCKRFCNDLIISFHEGWLSDWMSVECNKCKKVIWVCEFKNDGYLEKLYKKQKRGKNKNNLEGVRIFIKDDKKCYICKKPTNHYDCISLTYFGNKQAYLCSRKCDKKFDKIIIKKQKKVKGGKNEKDI